MPATVIETPEDLAAHGPLPAAGTLPARRRVLVAAPSHYQVTRQDNPHTVDEHGNLHPVDDKAAMAQWQALCRAYEAIGIEPVVVQGRPGLPDMVFTANTSFVYRQPGDDGLAFVPARMRYEGRRGEVDPVAKALAGAGYEPTKLPAGLAPFEAAGDLLWWGTRRLLVGATGQRTDAQALRAAASMADAPLVALELSDPDFFHLDTCLAVLDERTLAWVPAGLSQGSRELLRALEESGEVDLVEVPEDEARGGLACNLHGPDGQHVLIDQANRQTVDLLESRGYGVIGVDTGEFRKSGGSVFCMKNQIW